MIPSPSVTSRTSWVGEKGELNIFCSVSSLLWCLAAAVTLPGFQCTIALTCSLQRCCAARQGAIRHGHGWMSADNLYFCNRLRKLVIHRKLWLHSILLGAQEVAMLSSWVWAWLRSACLERCCGACSPANPAVNCLQALRKHTGMCWWQGMNGVLSVSV